MNHQTHILRTLSFGLSGLLILVLICATILEKAEGSPTATSTVYASPFFVFLWGSITFTSILYIIQRKQYRHFITFLLHFSLIVILIGALTTYLIGIQGSIHLRQDEPPIQAFSNRNGTTETLPFTIALKDFQLAYYPGTQAPMDFISTLSIQDKANTYEGKVSMNHIYTHRNYRFYQSTYDADGKGSTLSISYDPYGITITYIGYLLLLCSLILFFFNKSSRFRQLLHHPSLRQTVCLLILLTTALTQAKAQSPHTLSLETAARFGNLYIYYNNRVCPLQTLARDFTTKLYGKPSYKGLTAEQVLTGWFFYYDTWKEEPFIRIKDKKVRQLLNTGQEYVRLTDFIGTQGYKLEKALQTSTGKERQAIEEANEKFNLISMICTGNMLKIYPYQETRTSSPVWLSISDKLPASMPQEQWTFIRYSMNYIAEQIARKNYQEADRILEKTRQYQIKEAQDYLPSDSRFIAEKLYNQINRTRHLAMFCLTIGILSFAFYCQRLSRQMLCNTWVNGILLSLLGFVLIYLITIMVLQGFISGHLPVANGFETMQFMACSTVILTFFLFRKFEAVIAFGFMLCGLTLLVATLGEANPPITQLMPVLNSPLLSIHVATIMIAYSLMAFTMMNGVTALILHYSHRQCEAQIERLYIISQLILYPAVFCLTIGIFIGAVWANVSWGRYWGWDPKEVWALITMLIYAATLHPTSLPAFRRPMFFHWFTIIAFLSVLVTYFGVNFILGGMHSYA